MGRGLGEMVLKGTHWQPEGESWGPNAPHRPEIHNTAS